MEKNNFNKENNPTQWAQSMAEVTIDVDEAVGLLKGTFPIRSVAETIGVAVKEAADRLNISEDAARIMLEKQVGKQTVVRWLTPGRTNAITKDMAIKVAFALKMPYIEAEKLLKKLWLDGFHMRNIKDVVCRYGLENNWDYKTADDMVKEFKVVFPNITDANIESQNDDEAKGTEFVNLQYEKGARTKEEFEEFVRQNEKYFGSYRRTAYDRFKEYINELKDEWSDSNNISNDLQKTAGGELPAYTHGGISDAEIGERIIQAIPDISGNETLDHNLRTLIASNIPGIAAIRQAISEIINRHRQVDRKLYLLAYLASEDSILHDTKKLLADKKLTEEERNNEILECFKEHIEIINDDVLRPCGMSGLDSRHPFDWIIMNSLRRAYYEQDDYSTDDLQELVDRLRSYESEGE